jgi:hypothetical protein
MTTDPSRSSSGNSSGAIPGPGANDTGGGLGLRRMRSSAIPMSVSRPNEPAAATLGDEALRMEVHDAINEPLPQQDIERRDEMQHQRRTAGK